MAMWRFAIEFVSLAISIYRCSTQGNPGHSREEFQIAPAISLRKLLQLQGHERFSKIDARSWLEPDYHGRGPRSSTWAEADDVASSVESSPEFGCQGSFGHVGIPRPVRALVTLLLQFDPSLAWGVHGQFCCNRASVISAPYKHCSSRFQSQMMSKPALWDALWQLPPLQPGTAGSKIGFADFMQGVKSGIEEEYMDIKNSEGVPTSGPSQARGDGMFEVLRSLYDQHGAAYKTKLGIASGISVADPVMIRHILKTRGSFDKGVLGLVSEDIFGQGLITATDKDVWTSRRNVVAPGFHKRWLEGIAKQFVQCTSKAFPIIDDAARNETTIDLENVYLNLGLDIVGKTIFNFEFGSVAAEDSPVVSAVYRLLKETGYRIENPLLLALALLPQSYSSLLPQAKEYRDSFQRLDSVLDEVINAAAQAGTDKLDIESLQQRDLSNAEDLSLLRFLLDVRGEDTSSARLKDDLRTLLIAGHETVASIMTWATFELAQNPEIMTKARAEIDTVLGNRDPTYEDVKQLEYLRLVITETLRMYPAPPVLMRRTLQDEVLPEGSQHGADIPLKRGTLLILQMAMLHRNPALYDSPDVFKPERWLEPFGPNSEVPGWNGYDPGKVTGLGPNEISSDYAFVPFGAGEFKCVGDQFAMMEATIVLAMLLQRYEFAPAFSSLKDVGIDIAATIHTKNGLRVHVSHRNTADPVPAA